MNDTDMTTYVNNTESEGSSAREDGGIIDMEMTVPKGAGQETPSQLVAAIAAFNRPLISRQLVESIAAFNRPLISRQLVESIAAFNRPLISRQLVESIAAFNRPLISRQLVESIAAFNRPLISRQLVESIAAFNLRAATLLTLWVKKSMDLRTVTAPNFSRQSVGAPEKLKIWSSSEVAEAEDTDLATEKLHWLAQFDAFVTDSGLRGACRSLFGGGYYALAVQRACTYIDNTVRQKSGYADKDGAGFDACSL